MVATSYPARVGTRRHAALASLGSIVIGLSAAHATITQVDGTIIPVGNRLQAVLNSLGEPLNARLDAAELPEVFLPNVAQPVVFRDHAEGAGFENSFGWYNVGDDVSSLVGRASNLHPILGCGTPMQNHAYDPANPAAHADHQHGNPAQYVRNAEPPAMITVDFAAEQAAGRYDGGFIGFYLITPEGNGGRCGDADYLTRADVFFGRIYFTQKDLNDDGDFVHHLVYSSALDADTFYFGFEDLFRGGDNDFEDMMIGVDGLTPPCVPTVEVCDGIDNDCDDLVDVDDPDLTGEGEPCQCDNVDLTCSDGAVFGECRAGETICQQAELQCASVVAPSPEVCDGLDNNCNNAIDDNPSGTGAPCDGPDADLCQEGVEVCTAGALSCSDDTGPNLERCNGSDDDCDGMVDESPIDVGGSCGSSLGECSPGTLACVAGAPTCTGDVGPSPERCDGLDNDCDAVIDDAPIDVGQSCGVTDRGTCELGETICIGGTLDCAGEVGPVPETCDTRDNDCDGSVDESPVDVGQPCGTSVGICEPGVTVCTASGPVCDGAVTGTIELCNGDDDDCDGIIDEMPADAGGTCGDGPGVCEPGQLACIAGELQCVGGVTAGTEICNGLDDDCDGVIDDGDLCQGGVCEAGECATACAEGEFQCPIGRVCENGFCVQNPCFGVTCVPNQAGEPTQCIEGVCTPLCDRVSCAADLVCRPRDGACVPNTCEFVDGICAADELCRAGTCVSDPCFEVSCEDDAFCRRGECVGSCAGIDCDVAERCVDGACEATGCSVDCSIDQVCDRASGQCVISSCLGVRCGEDEACDPETGACVEDPCFGVVCPGDQLCAGGDCFARPDSADAGPPAEYVTAAGGGGCSAGGGAPSALWALGIALWALALPRRRRRGWLVMLAVCGLLVSGCDVSEYCINCPAPGASSDAGAGNGDSGTSSGGDAGAGGDASIADCDRGVVFPEACDELDNDCDGQIDEAFDLTADVRHCGACGNLCDRSGAISTCNEGACELVGCFPGNIDLDGDTAGAYESSNGCEYRCFVSNAGEEACDGIDNDCDGELDEAFDLQGDENNCGQCGRVCGFFQVTGAECRAGVCAFDGQTDCNPGFFDIDGQQANGCEYRCSASNGGQEACDLVDNDCDGAVDEAFDLQTDVRNCGQCGAVCRFANASPSCVAGACTFDPARDCNPGFHDANGRSVDGCEYACNISNAGVEICDSIDNDCNGVADDNLVDTGGACNSAPGGVATGACTNSGQLICSRGGLVCMGAPGPTSEVCNAVDDDCDGSADEGVTRACYTGAAGTEGVGECRGGEQACIAGRFEGACVGQTLPRAEACNNRDDDCDATIDEAAAGGPLVRACYDGTPGTAGIGECVSGNQTCTFGVYGVCRGQIVDEVDICGDGADSDCDGQGDAGEGCTTVAGEVRLDAAGGALGTAAGARHSFDLTLASGGSPVGQRVYAVWSDLTNGTSDIFFRRSTDGGASWGDIINLTSSVNNAAVQPRIAVAPAAGSDRIYIAYQSVNGGVRDIRVQTSSDNGSSFSAPTAALDGPVDAFHHELAISADGATVAIVWEALNTGTLTRNIVSRVSTDSGATYAAARTINVGSGASPLAGRPQVGITSGGRFIWVWREARGGATPNVYAAFSDSATAAIPAANERRLDGDAGDNRNSDFPKMNVTGNRVYVVWQDLARQQGGGSDAMFVRSTDAGASFGSERVLDDPAGEVSASFTPALAVDPAGAGGADDRIFVAWEDRRQGTQIFTSTSTDGGASFANPLLASSAEGMPLVGVTRRPAIAYAGGDVVVLAYTSDLGQGTTTEHVFATSSIDAGMSWSFTHQRIDEGAGKALSPVITRATGGGFMRAAVIGWIDFRSQSRINGDPYARRLGQ